MFAEMQFKDVLIPKFIFINLSALCILLVAGTLACSAVLGSIIMSDSRAASQAKFASPAD